MNYFNSLRFICVWQNMHVYISGVLCVLALGTQLFKLQCRHKARATYLYDNAPSYTFCLQYNDPVFSRLNSCSLIINNLRYSIRLHFFYVPVISKRHTSIARYLSGVMVQRNLPSSLFHRSVLWIKQSLSLLLLLFHLLIENMNEIWFYFRLVLFMLRLVVVTS